MGLVAARFVLVRTCGRRERPPALCAVFSWSPLAYGRVPYPPYARCGMGRLCGERRADGASVSSAFMRKKRGLGQEVADAAGPCLLSQPAREPPRAPAPAAAGASLCPPLCVMGGGAAPVLLRASVSSVQRMQETRLGAGGGGCRRALLVVPAGKGAAACARSRRGRRVAVPTARAMGAGLARHVARKRFERPSDARNAAWGRRWRMPPGPAPAPAVRGLEGRSPPKCIRIARLRRAGGEFAPLGANIPYAGRRPAKPAAKPPAK